MLVQHFGPPCDFSLNISRTKRPFIFTERFVSSGALTASSGDLPAEKKGGKFCICHRNLSQGLGNGFHLRWLPACRGRGKKKKEISYRPTPFVAFVRDALETHASTTGLENAKEGRKTRVFRATFDINMRAKCVVPARDSFAIIRASIERRDKWFDIFYQR